MENLQNSYPATPEGVWAGFHELRQLMKENEIKAEKAREKKRAEEEKWRAEEEKWRAEEEKRRAAAEKDRIAADKRMKKLEEFLGSWANNFGSFAEEYFFNSFENEQQNFFGEHFNEIRKKVKPKGKNLEDEYDIVMYNDSSVAIVEVKSKAHINDVQKVLKKAETFRILCPDYADFNIYLGFASLSFYEELEKECIDQGIAIIKQVGDTVVINDAHLKVY